MGSNLGTALLPMSNALPMVIMCIGRGQILSEDFQPYVIEKTKVRKERPIDGASKPVRFRLCNKVSQKTFLALSYE